MFSFNATIFPSGGVFAILPYIWGLLKVIGTSRRESGSGMNGRYIECWELGLWTCPGMMESLPKIYMVEKQGELGGSRGSVEVLVTLEVIVQDVGLVVHRTGACNVKYIWILEMDPWGSRDCLNNVTTSETVGT